MARRETTVRNEVAASRLFSSDKLFLMTARRQTDVYLMMQEVTGVLSRNTKL